MRLSGRGGGGGGGGFFSVDDDFIFWSIGRRRPHAVTRGGGNHGCGVEDERVGTERRTDGRTTRT